MTPSNPHFNSDPNPSCSSSSSSNSGSNPNSSSSSSSNSSSNSQSSTSTDNLAQTIAAAAKMISELGAAGFEAAHQLVEQATQQTGQTMAAVAENPVTRLIAKLPGLDRLLTLLGQVDGAKAQAEVDELRRAHPLETPDSIAHRLILNKTLQAGSIGLLTNALPPLALVLFAVDIVAITKLQAEMIYRVAAAYGFSLTDPTRRGEVLAVFGLFWGGAGVLKTGLSFVELLPGIGAAVGASSDALLIYSLGAIACRFYEAKLAQQQKNQAASPPVPPVSV